MVIISITGTKGKTSIARLLDFVLNSCGKETLRVDSDGHYINGEKKSNYSDSIRLFGNLAPTVCPGKYLICMKEKYPDFYAIMESSIGCAREGTGYEHHQVGVFSNVYNDHITGEKNRRSRRDLAKEKSFIFRKTSPDGAMVFNADDKNVCVELKKVRSSVGSRKIVPVGINFSFFNIKKHFKTGGMAVTIKDGFFVLQSKDETKRLLKISDVEWIVDESFQPAVYNCLLAIGTLFSLQGGDIPSEMLKSIAKYELDLEGGRMVFLKSSNGPDIIFDYAHEKYSLFSLAELGRKISKGRVIGILRLAPNNRDKEIAEISKAIASFFDEVYVYDKLDGEHRGAYIESGSGFSRGIGEVSEIFSNCLSAANKKAKIERFVLEEDAVKNAAMSAKKGDLVIAIWGDNKKRSLRYISEYFKA